MPFQKGNKIWFGRKHSEESKLKISVAHIGIKHSEESRQKISFRGKGRIPWNKGIKCHSTSGKEHWNWKGGRKISKTGYIKIYKPDHPFNKGGYVFEHRLVIERRLGRYLDPKEVVHHKGTFFPMGSREDKQDNRNKNLKLYINNGEHLRETRKGIFKKKENTDKMRQCFFCKSILTFDNFHKSSSHTMGFSYICKLCTRKKYYLKKLLTV